MVEPTARNDTSRPSPSILYEGREPSLKSSIFYSYVNNQRQNMPIPTSGFYRMFNFEVAGLGGNVEFLKMESMLSWHWPILFGVFNIGIQSGFISPLRKIVGCANDGIANRYFQDTQTRINDRLQIGGRLLARGYEYGKIGDKDEDDYLNGDALLAAGASFFISNWLDWFSWSFIRDGRKCEISKRKKHIERRFDKFGRGKSDKHRSKFSRSNADRQTRIWNGGSDKSASEGPVLESFLG